MDYESERELEEQAEALQEDWDENHPVCPECFSRMYEMSERYNLDFPYEDMWYECCSCGYTVSK